MGRAKVRQPERFAARFVNELGNTIEIRVVRICSTLCQIEMSGPHSESVNTITVKEARMLRNLLNDLNLGDQ